MCKNNRLTEQFLEEHIQDGSCGLSSFYNEYNLYMFYGG